MGNIVYKVVEDFDMKKNFKVYRLFQKILNPVINKKKKFKDMKISFDNKTVPIRVFNPFKSNEKHKIIVFIHGGGWITGSVESYTNICYRLAKTTNRIVISIEYRLAPEYPFPAGFDDCYDVIKLIYDNKLTLNIDSKDIAIIGDSAGGNLAAAVSQKALDKKEFRVSKQILLYPALQTDYSLSTKYKSVVEKGSNFLLTRLKLNDFINHYVKDKKDLDSNYVAPLYSSKLFGLPKTLLILAENDPLLDEGLAYYRKLKRHFVNAKYYLFLGANHGFLTNILDIKNKNLAYKKIEEFLKN